jgi:hypothetical protein
MLDVKFCFFSSMKLLYYYKITSLIWNIGFIISWTRFIGARKQLFYLMKHNRILYYQRYYLSSIVQFLIPHLDIITSIMKC